MTLEPHPRYHRDRKQLAVLFTLVAEQAIAAIITPRALRNDDAVGCAKFSDVGKVASIKSGHSLSHCFWSKSGLSTLDGKSADFGQVS